MSGGIEVKNEVSFGDTAYGPLLLTLMIRCAVD